ncbi:MAG: NTP transferase domain-containing protein [Syntrophobacterales bacterium]|jgi:GTP:adenosylcobinamide-phosphate guanylyltransferase
MKDAKRAFTALVLAADRTPGDPLVQAAGVSCKALVPVGGIPMVLRVLKALDAAQEIDTRILCGPHQSAIDQEAELSGLVSSGEVEWVENQATPSSSAYHALQSLPDISPVLVTTADHALLSGEMVDYFCREARNSGCDITVGLVSYELVAGTYPETQRTVTKLQDGGYCSCNLFGFLSPRAQVAADFWRKVESQRKKSLRVISVLGWMAVLRYLLGRLTLAEGLKQISHRLGLSAGAVLMPFPEAGIDVDTVDDWKLVEKIVADQRSQA